jgi:hypothetical protein
MPDFNFDGDKLKWKNKIHNLYSQIEKINGNVSLRAFGVNSAGCVDSGIRRIGLMNKEKLPAFPRMHNKFIICFNNDDLYTHYNDEDTNTYWFDFDLGGSVLLTGSYNYTVKFKYQL